MTNRSANIGTLNVTCFVPESDAFLGMVRVENIKGVLLLSRYCNSKEETLYEFEKAIFECIATDKYGPVEAEKVDFRYVGPSQ